MKILKTDFIVVGIITFLGMIIACCANPVADEKNDELFEPPEIEINHSSGEGFEVLIENKNGPQQMEFTSLDLAFDWIEENAVNNGVYIVRLGQNANIGKRQFYYDDKTVSIILISRDGLEKKIRPAYRTNIIFDVMPEVTLILDQGITLEDPNYFYFEASPVVVKGTLIMKSESTIKKNRDDIFHWDGVTIEATGEFVMNGGTIDGGKKGSIGIRLLGRATINNGLITSCGPGPMDPRGSGIFMLQNSYLIMNGGIISDCNADSDQGGGIVMDRNTFFVMNGGSITGNSAGIGGGVWLYGNAVFNMYGGVISNNTSCSGGGVYVDWNGKFNMFGGSIYGNTIRSSGIGGGVAVRDATFQKTGGEINANTILDYYTNEVIDGRGQAVYAKSSNSGLTVRMENTAGPTVKLMFNYNDGSTTASGDWDNF